MRSSITLFIIILTIAAQAGNQGLDAIRARRKTMTRIEHPVAQRMDNGALISVYADDSVKTQAVSMVKMSNASTAKVEEMLEDKATLKSAKALAAKLKIKHGKAVDGLTDAEIVAVSEQVLDTSAKDGATGAAVGLALAAAAAALGKTKKPKKEKPG